MGMPVATERYWTAEDVRQLPEDGSRYECVGGVLLVSPSPRQVHQAAVFELFHLLVDFVKENALGSLLGSPLARKVVCTCDAASVRRSDTPTMK